MVNQDEFEILCLNILSTELNLENTSDTPFVYTVAPLVPKKQLQMLSEMSFEKFEIPEVAFLS